MLYCIVGPSGCGKSTIVAELNKLGYTSVDSYTTRPKRTPDEKGHTFITDEEYNNLKNIVAHTVFNGYKYCVTTDMLKNCDLYIIDPPGIFTLKESGIDFKVIGLTLNKEECKNRMLNGRGDTIEKVEDRLKHDEKVFKDFEKICDYVINVNDSIENIVKQIDVIIKNNRRSNNSWKS
jgi:guanylate kinase